MNFEGRGLPANTAPGLGGFDPACCPRHTVKAAKEE